MKCDFLLLSVVCKLFDKSSSQTLFNKWISHQLSYVLAQLKLSTAKKNNEPSQLW